MDSAKKLRKRPPELGTAVDILSSASIFSTFDRRELEYLAAKSEILEYRDGQAVFEVDEPSERLFVLASGSVVIHSPEGGPVLAEFVAGDSFGEMEFLTEARRNARAVAGGPTRLLAFPSSGSGLKAALSDQPETAARILRSFLLVVAGRTRKANALVKENSPLVREMKRQVYGDKLTGLLNKAYLEENLPAMLAQPLALLMLKPDNFKEINDRFGHEAGDQVLVLLARELDRAVGTKGTAVRYMGNELAVIHPGLDRPRAVEAAAAYQSLLSGLDLSASTGEPGLRLSVSFGIALFPDHGADAEALVRAAAGLPLLARSRGGSLILFPEDIVPEDAE